MKKILVLGLFVVVSLPISASAYFTTNQTALQITETSSLFSIAYEFGSREEDTYMPILATRNQPWGSESTHIGFEILEDGIVNANIGTAQALVVSSAPIEDNMYKIAKETSQKFTLYVVLTINPDEPEADYSIRVTDLPFYRGDDKQKLQLNPSELQYYITPEMEFNESNPSKN